MVNFFLAKAGLKPGDVSIIGVGAAQGAVAAMRSGQIDAMSNLDPAVVRPGRLIGAHEFKRLNRTDAQRLADAKGLVLPEQDDFSLAEIYCGARSATVMNARPRIGFAH